MIDKTARRAELEAAVQKAEDLIVRTQKHLDFLRGGITMLNELITDEQQENQNVEGTS